MQVEYLKLTENIESNRLVYIDESGIEMTISKDRGWGKREKILLGEKSGRYYERTNIVAGYVEHKSEKTKRLIESVGCKVIFLPPYSPDLNPIEKFGANMKRWIKDKISQFDKLFDAIVN